MDKEAIGLSDFQSIKNQYKSRDQLDALASNLRLTTKSVREKYQAELSARDAEIKKARAEAAREAVMSSLVYAFRIQKNLLPPESEFQKAFEDYSILWNPRDIVSGDIYWIKNFDLGTVLCVCDCTGHGTPGALLTMLVVSSFGMIVNENNCFDTSQIIYLLDKQLSGYLYDSPPDGKEELGINDIKDGCDLAVLFISKNGDVTFSTANFPIFVCDGKQVNQIRGQKLFVGEGRLTEKAEVKSSVIPYDENNKFYISSDGMFDQKGGERGLPFGYSKFKKIILENHCEKQEVISGKVWEAFELYRDNKNRIDDFELISFKPGITVPNNKTDTNDRPRLKVKIRST